MSQGQLAAMVRFSLLLQHDAPNHIIAAVNKPEVAIWSGSKLVRRDKRCGQKKVCERVRRDNAPNHVCTRFSKPEIVVWPHSNLVGIICLKLVEGAFGSNISNPKPIKFGKP